MKTAWAYARFSSDHQREESIDAQLRAIQDYCQRSGYVLTNIYRDEAKSATTDDRPQFQQMFKDVNSTPPDVVIVHKLDRFSRDRYDSAFYKRKLKERGVQLVSVLENIDGSPESIILESVLEGMSEYYSKNLAREVKKGKNETAHQCKHNGGNPPLGYNIDENGNYVINPSEAAVVRQIFEMYAEDTSYTKMAEKLNKQGHRTKWGRAFTQNSFHDILKNEKYKGLFLYGKTAVPLGTKRVQKEPHIIVEDGVPAIVEPDLWERVNQKMKENRKRNAAKGAKRIYLLSGIIFCGECGARMTGNTRKAGRTNSIYSGYECSNRKKFKTCSMKGIKKEDIEAMVIDYLENEFFNEKNVTELVQKLKAHSIQYRSDSALQLQALKKELANEQKGLDHILSLIEAGEGKPWMIEKGDQHYERINYCKDKIAYIESLSETTELTEKQMYDYIMKDRDVKKKSPEAQKRIIQTYVEKVVIFNDRVDIHLIVNKSGADEGNRTPVASLGSWSSTIEPHPHKRSLTHAGPFYYI